MAKVLTAAAVARMTHSSVTRARSASRRAKGLVATRGGVEEVGDGQATGLYLQLYPSGRKAWALRYRRPFDDRPAKLVLGPVISDAEIDAKPLIGAPLSLAAARRLVGELKHAIANGRDPGAERQRAKHAEASTPGTFAGAARDFVIEHRTRAWKQTARFLGLAPDENGALEIIPGGLADVWGDRPLSTITEDDLFRAIDASRTKGVPGLPQRKGRSEPRARRFHASLSVMFGWFKSHRLIAVNPMAGLDRPKGGSHRERILTDAEIVKFWNAAEQEPPVFAVPLKLLLLTGQRRGEVEGMHRSEISADGSTWTIPGERTKNHRTHVVELTPMARDLIRSQEVGAELLFTVNGKTPINLGSKLKRRLDARMQIAPWRTHDLRRTVASGMARLGIDLPVIEKILNHISGSFGGIVGVYQHYQFEPEKRAALERWANHVSGLVAGRPDAVVPLRKAREA